MIRISLILLLLFSTSLQAAVHRWVDEEGNVHYSDKAPAKETSEKLELRINRNPPDPATVERFQRQKRMLEANQIEREDKKTRELADKHDAEQLLAKCKAAQGQLNVAEHSGRVFTVDEKGERRYMEEQQRQDLITEARQAIEQYCK